MQERLLAGLVDLGRRRGRAILVVATLATVVGAGLASRGRISTSQHDLLPSSHPVQRDFRAFVDEFGAADSLIVVLDGKAALLPQVADALAARLRNERAVIAKVFHKIDLRPLVERAPLFAPVEVLERAATALAAQRL